MPTLYTFYPTLLISSSILSGLLLVLLIKYRTNLIAQSLIGLALVSLGTNLSLYLAMYSPNLESAVFWHGNVRLTFNAFIASLGFLFAYTFLGGENKKLLWLILAVPLLTIPIGLTNGLHHGLFSAYTLQLEEYYLRTSWQPGGWFLVISIQSYLVTFGVFYLLISRVSKTRQLPLSRGILIIGVISLILIMITLDTAGLLAAPGLLNLPVGLGLMNLILIIGIWYLDLFDILPVARETLIRYMSDCVLVVDIDNQILDVNPATARLVHLSIRELIGTNVLDLISLPERREAARRILESEFHGISPFAIDGQDRDFDILVTNILIDKSLLAAKLIVMRDITQLRRLQEQDRQRIALEERQRLARDLHDAVSQTLFSARLTSEMLLRQRKIVTPEMLWENIAHFSNLVKSALGEMRILLLELRPESLTNAELSILLTHLVDAAGSRSDAKITLDLQGPIELPVEVKIAFYRITQEALNNIIKHARSRSVKIQYLRAGGEAKLIITDDGIGLVFGESKGAPMGMQIMRERASEVGAQLEITSQIGKGTQVTCLWQSDGSA